MENLSWIYVFFLKVFLQFFFLKCFSVNGKSELDLCLSEMVRQSSLSCANWQFRQLLLHKTFWIHFP